MNMKKMSGWLVVIFVLSTVGLYAGEWTGFISDVTCAAKQGEDPDHTACAKRCVGRGADAVFVSQGKIYTLDKQEDVKKLAGEKVLLKGTASEDGKSIKVESIAKADK